MSTKAQHAIDHRNMVDQATRRPVTRVRARWDESQVPDPPGDLRGDRHPRGYRLGARPAQAASDLHREAGAAVHAEEGLRTDEDLLAQASRGTEPSPQGPDTARDLPSPSLERQRCELLTSHGSASKLSNIEIASQ